MFYDNSQEGLFWKWFYDNDKLIYNFEDDTERIFDLISNEINKINPHLTFEIGPIEEDGKRDFVISADGIIDAFPAVKTLFGLAPYLKNWNFIKFRPRRNIHSISYGGKSVSEPDIFYKLYSVKDKVGIQLFINGYNKDEHEIYSSIGYLLLDDALGEYDVETKVSFVEFHDINSTDFNGARSISELSIHFDSCFKNPLDNSPHF